MEWKQFLGDGNDDDDSNDFEDTCNRASDLDGNNVLVAHRYTMCELRSKQNIHVPALSLCDSSEPVPEIINRASGRACLRKGGLATAQQQSHQGQTSNLDTAAAMKRGEG